MGDSNLPSADLLKSVLEPLLEDFQYWFERYDQILENEKIQFMSEQEQLDLLKRVKDAQDELNTARMLFTATDQQVGIDMATVNALASISYRMLECGNAFRSVKGMNKPLAKSESRGNCKNIRQFLTLFS